jgi:lipoyl(octanoyl) transferase
MPRTHGEWAWLGRSPYVQVAALQERVREQVASGGWPNTLLMLEHEPVITLGRNGDARNIVASPDQLLSSGADVVRTSRGGDVTYHGPGQLVGYPIFRLTRGVRAHVCAIADGIVAALADLGIASEWHASRPGVWVGDQKICALGVHVRRGVAIHGFALNASVDLAAFRAIIPCGLHGFGVTSIAREIGASPDIESLAVRVMRSLSNTFHMDLTRIAPACSRLQIANGNL